MEAEPAPLEAGARLGQSMSANPHCYAAGTFSRSVTQVFVLLREVILFVLKGQRAGRLGGVICLMLLCGCVQVSGD